MPVCCKQIELSDREWNYMELRPGRLLCLRCLNGGGFLPFMEKEGLKDKLCAIKKDPQIHIRLVTSFDEMGARTEMFYQQSVIERKRDLDVLQKLGLSPGDTRIARDLYEVINERIKNVKDICAYGGNYSDKWPPCPLAKEDYFQKGAEGLNKLKDKEKSRMDKISTKKIVLNGVMIALVFLATIFTRIPGPIPPGYINFGDTVIIIAAILLGKNSGFIAGSFGSALADIIAPGGIIFAPATFVVKGIEGYLVGKIAGKRHDLFKKEYEKKKITAIASGMLVMVAGYFAAELSILKLFDPAFGYTAAISELPFNLIQGGVSAVLGYLLSALLQKAGVERLLD